MSNLQLNITLSPETEQSLRLLISSSILEALTAFHALDLPKAEAKAPASEPLKEFPPTEETAPWEAPLPEMKPNELPSAPTPVPTEVNHTRSELKSRVIKMINSGIDKKAIGDTIHLFGQGVSVIPEEKINECWAELDKLEAKS